MTIWLSGIEVLKCPRCKGEAPIIPRLAELHRVLAKEIVKKPKRLSGAEQIVTHGSASPITDGKGKVRQRVKPRLKNPGFASEIARERIF